MSENVGNVDYLFDDGVSLSPSEVWKLYEAGDSYNDSLKLYDVVKDNENMFIGKQWEGVTANGLPTPQMNIVKRTVMFKVATVTSDDIKVNVTPLDAATDAQQLYEPSRIVAEEFDALMERCRVVRMNREFCRDAAVRGDGCLYTYWDDSAETGRSLGGEKIKGQIVTEVLQNTRVYFGDPNERRVQKQPYIIIKSYLPEREARRRAKRDGVSGWENIKADEDDKSMDSAKKTDDKVTVLLFLWKDPESGEVWGYETTEKTVLREPWNLSIRLYPVVWLNWDYVQDCYHGQAEVSGLIPNQVAINKVWAAAILCIMTSAFPKILYDPTRIKNWTNQIGVAVKCIGGDMDNAAKVLNPGSMAPQVYQFLSGLVEQTEKSMGVTAIALGDTRPDNTSAIIALQRSAATPMELTKLADYECIEDLFRIYLEYMIFYYGKRSVDTQTPDKVTEAIEFAQPSHPELEKPSVVTTVFDFSTLADIPMKLKIDVGASSYFSEISSLTTLSEWMKIGAITPRQCAERLPSGFLPKMHELVAELKEKEEREAAAAGMAAAKTETLPQPANQTQGAGEVTGGGGYSALQRAINESGEVPDA